MRDTASSHLFFDTALRGTLEAVIIVNQQGIVLDWNTYAETIFGWTRRSIIGQHVRVLFEPDNLDVLQEAMQRVVQAPQAPERHYALRARHETGLTFSVEISLQVLVLQEQIQQESISQEQAEPDSPNSRNFCIFLRDIEKFKDAYTELRKRERRYRILSYFSASIFGDDTIEAVLWDIAKNCIAELDFEDAVVYQFDSKRQVLVQIAAFGSGKELNETIVNPLEIPLGRGIVGSTAANGITERIGDTSLDARYIVDDAVRFSELTVPIIHRGQLLGVIDSEHSEKHFFTEEDTYIVEQMAAIAATKIVRIQAEQHVKEINERLELLVEQRTQDLSCANQEIQRQVEMLAQQAQEIELANVDLGIKNEELSMLNAELDNASRFKTEMLSIVAHDLKNPLSVIMSSAELILIDSSEETSSRGYAGRIVETSRYMLKLITGLLDAAAIDLGRIELRKEYIPLAPILAAVCDNFQSQAQTKRQKITFSYSSSVNVFGDEERLYQVFENLVSNAIKYSPLGKHIDVKMYSTAENRVCASVRDEGQGLNNEDKRKLFGFFQRLSARPTAGETSNGVGLAIVKKIVDLHEGKISVESELGQGATFIVELPIAQMV